MRRKLSQFEAAGLNFSRHNSLNFALAAHIKGEITAAQVRKALPKICQKYPFLAARVVEDNWYDTDGLAEIPIIRFSGAWTDQLQVQLPRVFDNKAEAQFRLLLGTDGTYTDLVLVIDHVIADGLSAFFILRDLFHYIAYPDAAIVPLTMLPEMGELLPPAMPKINENVEPPSEQPRQTLSPELTVPDSMIMVIWELTETQTVAFITQCHRYKVTIHSALCAAFLNVFARLDPSGVTLRRVSSPVNVRQRLTMPVGEQIGNYINSGIRTSLDCTSGRDFWDMARDIHTALEKDINDEKLFEGIRQFYAMVKNGPPSDSPGSDGDVMPPADYDLSISNLGRLAVPVAHETLKLESIYGPILSSRITETIVGVATVENKMTFSLVTSPRLMSRAHAEQIREQFTQLLTNIAGFAVSPAS